MISSAQQTHPGKDIAFLLIRNQHFQSSQGFLKIAVIYQNGFSTRIGNIIYITATTQQQQQQNNNNNNNVYYYIIYTI